MVHLDIIYDLAGNEGGYFEMHEQTGELYLVREIDLESLSTDVINLQIQVRQIVPIILFALFPSSLPCVSIAGAMLTF